MSKKTKGLIVYIGVIVFGVIVGILSYSVFQTETEPTPAPDLEQYLIKTPNTLRSKWDRRIETKQTTAGIEVINNYDAYKITVPESAEVPLIADGSQGLQIYYEHTVENTNEGPVLLLDILPLNNSQNHSLSKWALLNPAA
ncbi:MAG: hypothetical protein R3251_02965, partial [Candidatus Spechtbacterales bacterium]|nr:hypothetical protein [Candidatus Spechtbacterales bacterium]